MQNVGQLELNLFLNKSSFDRTLADAEKDARRLNNTRFVINPVVNHKPLNALNEHLNLKKSHFDSLNRHFKSNPLTPSVNLEPLMEVHKLMGDLSATLNIEVEHKMTSGKSASNSYDNLERSLSNNIGSLRDILKDIASNTKKPGLVGKAIGTISEGLIFGAAQATSARYGEGIAKGLERSLKVNFDRSGRAAGAGTGRNINRVNKVADLASRELLGAPNGLKDIQRLATGNTQKIFNNLTDLQFYKDLEELYVELARQGFSVGDLLGKQDELSKNPRIKAELDKFGDRFNEYIEDYVVRGLGAALRLVTQPIRINKRVALENSALTAIAALLKLKQELQDSVSNFHDFDISKATVDRRDILLPDKGLRIKNYNQPLAPDGSLLKNIERYKSEKKNSEPKPSIYPALPVIPNVDYPAIEEKKSPSAAQSTEQINNLLIDVSEYQSLPNFQPFDTAQGPPNPIAQKQPDISYSAKMLQLNTQHNQKLDRIIALLSGENRPALNIQDKQPELVEVRSQKSEVRSEDFSQTSDYAPLVKQGLTKGFKDFESIVKTFGKGVVQNSSKLYASAREFEKKFLNIAPGRTGHAAKDVLQNVAVPLSVTAAAGNFPGLHEVINLMDNLIQTGAHTAAQGIANEVMTQISGMAPQGYHELLQKLTEIPRIGDLFAQIRAVPRDVVQGGTHAVMGKVAEVGGHLAEGYGIAEVVKQGIQKAVDTVAPQKAQQDIDQLLERANNYPDPTPKLENPNSEAIQLELDFLKFGQLPDSPNVDPFKNLNEAAKRLDRIFTAAGPRKLSPLLGIPVTTLAGDKPIKSAKKADIIDTILARSTPESLEAGILSSSASMKRKGYQHEAFIKPQIDEEQFEQIKRYLRDRIGDVLSTDVSVLDADSAIAEIDRINQGLNKLIHEKELLSSQAESRGGFVSQLNEINTALQAFSKFKNIGDLSSKFQDLGASKADAHWGNTTRDILKNFRILAAEAKTKGYDIQRFISEGSPGPSERTRLNWLKTAKYVIEQIKSIEQQAKISGSKSGQVLGNINTAQSFSLDPSRAEYLNRIKDQVVEFQKLLNDKVNARTAIAIGGQKMTDQVDRGFYSKSNALDKIQSGVPSIDFILEQDVQADFGLAPHIESAKAKRKEFLTQIRHDPVKGLPASKLVLPVPKVIAPLQTIEKDLTKVAKEIGQAVEKHQNNVAEAIKSVPPINIEDPWESINLNPISYTYPEFDALEKDMANYSASLPMHEVNNINEQSLSPSSGGQGNGGKPPYRPTATASSFPEEQPDNSDVPSARSSIRSGDIQKNWQQVAQIAIARINAIQAEAKKAGSTLEKAFKLNPKLREQLEQNKQKIVELQNLLNTPIDARIAIAIEGGDLSQRIKDLFDDISTNNDLIENGIQPTLAPRSPQLAESIESARNLRQSIPNGVDSRKYVTVGNLPPNAPVPGDPLQFAADGYDALGNALDRLPTSVRVFKEIKNFLDDMAKRSRTFGKILEFGKSLAISAVGLFSFDLLSQHIGNIGRQLLESGRNLQIFKNQIDALGKSGTGEAGKIFTRSQELGTSYLAGREGYQRFNQATSGIASDTFVDPVFEGFQKAFVSKGANADQQKRGFTALEQILSKGGLDGSVQSEELKGQLAEALPGAFQVAATVRGQTPKELAEDMKAANVEAADLLVRMAAFYEIDSEILLRINSQSFDAELNRAMNNIELLKEQTGENFLPFARLSLRPVNAFFEAISEHFAGIATLGGATILVALYKIGAAMIEVTKQTKLGTIAAKAFALQDIKNFATQSIPKFATQSVPNFATQTLPTFVTQTIPTGAAQLRAQPVNTLRNFGTGALSFAAAAPGYLKLIAVVGAAAIAIDLFSKAATDGRAKLTTREASKAIAVIETTRPEDRKEALSEKEPGFFDIYGRIEKSGADKTVTKIRDSETDVLEKIINIQDSIDSVDFQKLDSDLDEVNSKIGILQAKRLILIENKDLKQVEILDKELEKLNVQKKDTLEGLTFQLGNLDQIKKSFSSYGSDLESIRPIIGDDFYNKLKEELETIGLTVDQTKMRIEEAIASLGSNALVAINKIKKELANTKFSIEVELSQSRGENIRKRLSGILSNKTLELANTRDVLTSKKGNAVAATEARSGFEQKILNDPFLAPLNTRLGANNTDELFQILQETTPETLDSYAKEAETTSPELAKQLVLSKEYTQAFIDEINARTDLAQSEHDVVNQNKEYAKSLFDFGISIRDFGRSLEDLQISKERFEQDFPLQVEAAARNINRSARALAEQYDDFVRGLDKQIVNLQIEITDIDKQIKNTRTRNRANSFFTPGTAGFGKDLTDLFLEYQASIQTDEEKTLAKNLSQIDLEEQVLTIARRIRDIAEQKEDLERDRVAQALSLLRQQEDFNLQQKRSWEDNLVQWRNIELQSQDLGVALDLTGAQIAQQGTGLIGVIHDLAERIKSASTAFDDSVSNSSSNGSTSTSIIDALRRAIIGHESDADYKAVNKDSGALGYGQVIPENLEEWTKAALGKALTKDEFLNNKQAQLDVIDYKLKEYFQKEILAAGGDQDLAIRRVASTWYGGGPDAYNNTESNDIGDTKYPTNDEYTKDILARTKKELDKSSPAPLAVPEPAPIYSRDAALPPPHTPVISDFQPIIAPINNTEALSVPKTLSPPFGSAQGTPDPEMLEKQAKEAQDSLKTVESLLAEKFVKQKTLTLEQEAEKLYNYLNSVAQKYKEIDDYYRQQVRQTANTEYDIDKQTSKAKGYLNDGEELDFAKRDTKKEYSDRILEIQDRKIELQRQFATFEDQINTFDDIKRKSEQDFGLSSLEIQTSIDPKFDAYKLADEQLKNAQNARTKTADELAKLEGLQIELEVNLQPNVDITEFNKRLEIQFQRRANSLSLRTDLLNEKRKFSPDKISGFLLNKEARAVGETQLKLDYDKQIKELDSLKDSAGEITKAYTAAKNAVDALNQAKLDNLAKETNTVVQLFDESFQPALNKLLNDFIDKSVTAKDAWRAFATTILNSLADILLAFAKSELLELIFNKEKPAQKGFDIEDLLLNRLSAFAYPNSDGTFDNQKGYGIGKNLQTILPSALNTGKSYVFDERGKTVETPYDNLQFTGKTNQGNQDFNQNNNLFPSLLNLGSSLFDSFGKGSGFDGKTTQLPEFTAPRQKPSTGNNFWLSLLELGTEIGLASFSHGGDTEEMYVPYASHGLDTEDVALARGIKSAIAKEAHPEAFPAVLHKGEVVLSDLNGDAQMIRSLKASGEWNEMKAGVNNYQTPKVENYRNGSAIAEGMGRGKTVINNYTSSIKVEAKDVDSFKRTESQIARRMRLMQETMSNR